MFGILGLGFLLGMQHALEADHIAAVSSIAARRSHVADIVKHGLTWGLGHTLTLFVMHESNYDKGTQLPVPIQSVGDVATVTWWLNANPGQPGESVECPKLGAQ